MAMRKLQRAIGVLNTVLIVIAGVALLAVVLITAADVTCGVFGHRIRGSQELVGLAGALVVACALGQTQERKDHVPVDIITRKFPVWLNRAIDVIRFSVKLAFSLVVAWGIGNWAMTLRRTGELTENLRLPFYPVVMCVAGGFVVLACTVVLDLLRTLMPQMAGTGSQSPASADEILDEEEVPLP
jgi:TRAP-type C4-dicarboxylate transport system permease small subunit